MTPDGVETQQLLYLVSTLLSEGIRWIQYRDKRNTKRVIYQNAISLKQLTSDFGAILSINDYVDIALAVGAEGVHLGQDDLPLQEAKKIAGHMLVGISTHNLKQALDAQKGGADYIGFGPIFHTTTKNVGEPKGVSTLKRVKEFIEIPVIAIGGIKINNLKSVFNCGADGVALSSGLLIGDLRDNAQRFREFIEKKRRMQ